MLRAFLFLCALLPVTAAASDFDAGDEVACGQREGTVQKVFSRDSLLVRFRYSFHEGIPRQDEAEGVELGARCVRRLGEANSAGPDELSKGDTVLCGFSEGTVLGAYTRGIVKVQFYANYAEQRRAPISQTYFLDSRRCERQIAPGKSL